MEQGWNAKLGDLLEEWVEAPIAGIERLDARMKLGSRKTKIVYRPLDLVDCLITLVWVHAGKTNKLLWIMPDDLRDRIISQWFLTGCCLGIPREQHADDIMLSVVGRDLLDIAQLYLAAKVTLRGSAVFAYGDVHELGDG
jgi:hypothetical protein